MAKAKTDLEAVRILLAQCLEWELYRHKSKGYACGIKHKGEWLYACGRQLRFAIAAALDAAGLNPGGQAKERMNGNGEIISRKA